MAQSMDPKAISREENDEDLDETLSERLWGLTEMFPQCVQKALGTTVSLTTFAVEKSFSLGRVAMWVAASSATMLILPVVFESERAHQQEMEKQQQRQILLGPNAAVSGSSGQNLLSMMPPGMATAR